jgi:hypothetical protein
MIGGGGRGVASYIYPSLMDEGSSSPNFETVGERYANASFGAILY